MSWRLDIQKTPIADFVAAVDDADASGDVAAGAAGLQITQAKAVLVALANGGVLGDGEVEASAAGHAEKPFNFIVSVRELEEAAVEKPAAETAEAATPIAAPADVAPQPAPAEPTPAPAPATPAAQP